MREGEFVLGGQAVIEGVMMKGEKEFAVAVRGPSGEIVAEVFPITQGRLRSLFGKAFLLRGVVTLVTMLSIGVKALSFSARIAMEEEEEEVPSWVMPLTVAGALLLGVGLFFVLPYGAGVLFSSLTGFEVGSLSFNLFEGVLRAIVFLLYLWSITLFPDVRRVFQYHGAEHKVVNAWESGSPLTTDEVMKHSRFHPRCGTSFIFFVLLVSILVFSLIPSHYSLLAKGGLRILLLPVVAGISYEIIRMSGKRRESSLFRAVAAPGMFFQRFTTFEPEPDMVEVALESFRKISPEGEKPENAFEA
ncbi:MAG: DUF1385 domain-containing protein [Deltaproteobacteria bacterium]|nr:MAG: DUF1385 domain-containing protein [Deltaproteobacteria bacterium]